MEEPPSPTLCDSVEDQLPPHDDSVKKQPSLKESVDEQPPSPLGDSLDQQLPLLDGRSEQLSMATDKHPDQTGEGILNADDSIGKSPESKKIYSEVLCDREKSPELKTMMQQQLIIESGDVFKLKEMFLNLNQQHGWLNTRNVEAAAAELQQENKEFKLKNESLLERNKELHEKNVTLLAQYDENETERVELKQEVEVKTGKLLKCESKLLSHDKAAKSTIERLLKEHDVKAKEAEGKLQVAVGNHQAMVMSYAKKEKEVIDLHKNKLAGDEKVKILGELHVFLWNFNLLLNKIAC